MVVPAKGFVWHVSPPDNWPKHNLALGCRSITNWEWLIKKLSASEQDEVQELGSINISEGAAWTSAVVWIDLKPNQLVQKIKRSLMLIISKWKINFYKGDPSTILTHSNYGKVLYLWIKIHMFLVCMKISSAAHPIIDSMQQIVCHQKSVWFWQSCVKHWTGPSENDSACSTKCLLWLFDLVPNLKHAKYSNMLQRNRIKKKKNRRLVFW